MNNTDGAVCENHAKEEIWYGIDPAIKHGERFLEKYSSSQMHISRKDLKKA